MKKQRKEKTMKELLFQLGNTLDDLAWTVEDAKRELMYAEDEFNEKSNNRINDLDFFIKRLIAENLYSDEIRDFIDNYIKFYN